jgi:hypothetical protein
VSEPIHDRKPGGGLNLVSNGYYAVDPNDHVILIPPLQSLKSGWRLATQAEIDAKAPKIAKPIEPAIFEAPITPQAADPIAEPIVDDAWGGLPD